MTCYIRVLVVVDDPPNEVSERVATYAAGVLAGREGAEVYLLLVLPPTPAELLEFGSIEEMGREAAANAARTGANAHWLETTVAEAHPTMARARKLLEEAGLPAESIHERYEASMHGRHVAQHALDVARRCGCDTIALNHRHLAWYRRWLSDNPCGELLRKAHGLTLWFVN